MAMSANPDRPEDRRYEDEDELLPCGRLLMDVWDARDAGRFTGDLHLDDCPFCSAALADLADLGEAVGRTGAAEPGIPDATAVTARVMDLVRLELRPGRPLPLGDPGEDGWMVEAAAARLLRAAVDALPGVRAGSCRVLPLDPADPAGPVRTRVEVAVSAQLPMQDVAEAVRVRIAEVSDRDIGVRLAYTDVLVVDVLDGDIDHSTAMGNFGDAGGDGQETGVRP
ncbi:hypothetical protein [Streptomyces sp. NPDC049916]|uniref:hypothetical protein n=1 Tax=Streptomyces sp. NPDC049916 TaxID=3155156 RepID=UPI00342173ED